MTCPTCGHFTTVSLKDGTPTMWWAWVDTYLNIHVKPLFSHHELDDADDNLKVWKRTGEFPADTEDEAREKGKSLLACYIK